MKKTKEVKAWAIIEDDGRPLVGSTAETRREAIAQFIGDWNDDGVAWAMWRNEGLSCRRVSIVPVPKKRKRK